jgi:hypothetical protein
MDRWKREALNVAIVVIVMIAFTFPMMNGGGFCSPD